MELYNVLLVDDEAEVLLAMKKKIDWEALGFCLAGTAENGQEALEITEQLHINPKIPQKVDKFLILA